MDKEAQAKLQAAGKKYTDQIRMGCELRGLAFDDSYALMIMAAYMSGAIYMDTAEAETEEPEDENQESMDV